MEFDRVVLYKVGGKYYSNQPSKRASVWGRLRPAHSSYLGMGRRNLCLIALASLGALLMRVRLTASWFAVVGWLFVPCLYGCV